MEEIEKVIKLLTLCQVLQNEKDGINRPDIGKVDKTKTVDEFAKDILNAVTFVSTLYKILPIQNDLILIGKKLEKENLINLDYGDSYAEKALEYFKKNIL